MKLEKLRDLLEEFIDKYTHKVDDDTIEGASLVVNSIAELLDEDADDDDDDVEEDLTSVFTDD